MRDRTGQGKKMKIGVVLKRAASATLANASGEICVRKVNKERKSKKKRKQKGKGAAPYFRHFDFGPGRVHVLYIFRLVCVMHHASCVS